MTRSPSAAESSVSVAEERIAHTNVSPAASRSQRDQPVPSARADVSESKLRNRVSRGGAHAANPTATISTAPQLTRTGGGYHTRSNAGRDPGAQREREPAGRDRGAEAARARRR